MDANNTARLLLSAEITDDEVYNAVGRFLESCEDENGDLWITANKITADTIYLDQATIDGTTDYHVD